MTVAAIAPVVTYNEDGASTVFAVPFQFISSGDLVVERTDPAGATTLLVLGSDYSVAGGGGSVSVATGSITTTAPKPAGWTIGIGRATPRTQPANYTPGDTFPAEMHERALDREMLCIQELDGADAEAAQDVQELFARALRVPIGETVNEVPAIGIRSGKLLGFDGTGQPQAVVNSSKGDKGDSGAPGGNAMSIGLGKDIGTLLLATGTPATFKAFRTEGFYVAGDGGEGWYWRNPGAALPGDQVTGDGVRLSLSLAQKLTFEMLGAPSVGLIATGAIAGTALTMSALQSSHPTGIIDPAHGPYYGATVSEIGGLAGVAAGTRITGGSWPNFTVSIPQTVSSRVMVINDSAPYMDAARVLGVNGMTSLASHWFGQSPYIKGHAVRWSGASGYMGGGNNIFQTMWYVPRGYSALVPIPDNGTVNAQGDITLSGSVNFGGASGWIVEHIHFQVGDQSLPAATVNNRPGVHIYTPGKLDNWQLMGGDGDGLYIFGNAPTNLADKCLISNFAIQNVWGNGTQTRGGDGNTIEFSNGIVSGCGKSGVFEQGFLGNNYRSMQSQTTGQVNSFVRRSSNLYFSVQDGNINQDPLTTPAAWCLWYASAGPDTWSPTTTYQVGVSYRTGGGGNRSEFASCYTEGDAPSALGLAASGNQGLSCSFGGFFGWLYSNDFGSRGNHYGTVCQSSQFTSYVNDTYGYTTIGANGYTIGYLSNNDAYLVAGDNEAVYDAALGGNLMARFAGRTVYQVGRCAIVSSWNDAAVRQQIQLWSGEMMMTAPVVDNAVSLGGFTKAPAPLRWKDVFGVRYRPGSGGPIWTSGTGSPEGVVAAPVGSLYTREDGIPGATLYAKELGAAGATGWAAK
jgi:hypothetical protein